MNFKTAFALFAQGSALSLVTASGIADCPLKTPVLGVRPMPEEIRARAPFHNPDGYQTLVNSIGGQAWINVSPSMVATA